MVKLFNTKITTTRLIALCTLCLFIAAFAVALAEKLPSGVAYRLKKIDEYMTKVETALSNQKADQNNLDRAQQAMDEIKSQYLDSVSAQEVKDAQARIDKGKTAIEKLLNDKKSAEAEVANAEKQQDAIYEDWAKRMNAYKADTKEGTKGNFGVPMSDPKKIAQLKPYYLEAKALYEEFLKTGIDKDAHWML